MSGSLRSMKEIYVHYQGPFVRQLAKWSHILEYISWAIQDLSVGEETTM